MRGISNINVTENQINSNLVVLLSQKKDKAMTLAAPDTGLSP